MEYKFDMILSRREGVTVTFFTPECSPDGISVENFIFCYYLLRITSDTFICLAISQSYS
jgi:hypothetical protein